MTDTNATVVKGDEQQSFGRWLLETAVLVALAFALAQGIKTFIVQPFVVPSGSMLPTIQLTDRVLAEKLTYRFSRDPEYGDIVVFDNPNPNDPVAKIFIKRVIATGGQTVDIKNGEVYVDGKKLDEPYTHDKPTYQGTEAMPVKIPEDSIWLMGDNRTGSADSRFFGPRPIDEVHGKAFWTYWPPKHFGPLE